MFAHKRRYFVVYAHLAFSDPLTTPQPEHMDTGLPEQASITEKPQQPTVLKMSQQVTPDSVQPQPRRLLGNLPPIRTNQLTSLGELYEWDYRLTHPIIHYDLRF